MSSFNSIHFSKQHADQLTQFEIDIGLEAASISAGDSRDYGDDSTMAFDSSVQSVPSFKKRKSSMLPVGFTDTKQGILSQFPQLSIQIQLMCWKSSSFTIIVIVFRFP